LFSLPYWEQPNIYEPIWIARRRPERLIEDVSFLMAGRSWRIADVADASAPTTGTYLMNVYSVFKEQSAAFSLAVKKL